MRHGFRRLQAAYEMQHIGEKQKLYFEIVPCIQVSDEQTSNEIIRLCSVCFKNLGKGYLARKNLKFRPIAIGILQEKTLQYLAWRDVRREQIKVRRIRCRVDRCFVRLFILFFVLRLKTIKLEEYENLRDEEERSLTETLGPDKARESAQDTYETRLNNIDDDINEQLRIDIANARNKRAGIPRRNGLDSDGDDTGAQRVQFRCLSTVA
jgi:hypothetical protein